MLSQIEEHTILEYVNGEVRIDPSVALIKERLQDLEKEQKSLILTRSEELNEHNLNLGARHESLDQAKKKLVEYQVRRWLNS